MADLEGLRSQQEKPSATASPLLDTPAPDVRELRVEIAASNHGDWIIHEPKSQMTYLNPATENERKNCEYAASLGYLFMTTEDLIINLPQKIVLCFKGEAGQASKEVSYGLDYWIEGKDKLAENKEVKIPAGAVLFFAEQGKRIHPVKLEGKPAVNLLRFS